MKKCIEIANFDKKKINNINVRKSTSHDMIYGVVLHNITSKTMK